VDPVAVTPHTESSLQAANDVNQGVKNLDKIQHTTFAAVD